MRYVERNPVRAGLVAQAAQYPWSSAPAHVWSQPDPVLSGAFPPPGVIADWGEWLQEEEEAQSAHLRQQTHTGRPCGGEAFLRLLAHLLGRPVQPQKRGRKPKKAGEDGNS